MTMNEYKLLIAESIPMPTTIYQDLLALMVARINKQLKSKGEASLCLGWRDGNRKMICGQAKAVLKLYESKGYKTSAYFYAESNREDYVTFTIRI